MRALTKSELQVMHILWALEKAFIKDIIAHMAKPKPAYNTVSTIVRILQDKGFVDHEVFGKSHRYHPLVSKNAYLKFEMNQMLEGYFEGSPTGLVSFFVKNEKIDANDLEEMLTIIANAKKQKQ